MDVGFRRVWEWSPDLGAGPLVLEDLTFCFWKRWGTEVHEGDLDDFTTFPGWEGRVGAFTGGTPLR